MEEERVNMGVLLGESVQGPSIGLAPSDDAHGRYLFIPLDLTS